MRAGFEADGWPWADALDAVIAAPRHHTLLFENEHVRVLDVRIPSGDFVPVHTHRWPSVVHTLSASDFIRRDGEGQVLFDSRAEQPAIAPPPAIWLGPLPPHSVENVGNQEIRLFTVEIKNAVV